MEKKGGADLVEDVRDFLARRPETTRNKAMGLADLATAEEEVRFRRTLENWRQSNLASNGKLLLELEPVKDQDGCVLPILVAEVAGYVRRVVDGFCIDVLIGGFSDPLGLVAVVEAFPEIVVRDVFQRYSLSNYLALWDYYIDDPDRPTWARDNAISGPIDEETFVLLALSFAKAGETSIREEIGARVDQFWEDHSRVLRENLAANASPTAEKTEQPAGREAVVHHHLDENGWSVEDWANRAEVDYKTASDYLKGKTNPTRSTRKKLAGALQIPVNDLPK